MANREITDIFQEFRDRYLPFLHAGDLFVAGAFGLLLGFLRPFGTDQFPPLLAYGYWLTICVLGYVVYAPTLHFIDRFASRSIHVHWHRVALGTALASLLLAALVPVVTHIYFDQPKPWLQQTITAVPQTLVIGGVITLLAFTRDKLHSQKEQLVESEMAIEDHQKRLSELDEKSQSAGEEELMRQIPLEKRGKLLCLEMDDHYLKVHTDQGVHLLLMRFKDALNLLADFPGLQTHRSWWVADQAVVSVTRVDRKQYLVLSNGVKVPVSRTYSAKIREKAWK